MKKLFTLALAASAAIAAQGADFVVYEDGQLSADLNVYGWWAAGMNFDTNSPDRDDHTFKFNVENGGADGSMGIFTSGENVKTGPLHSATLNFNWYATGSAKYTIRLTAETGAEENYTFTVNAENANSWVGTSISVTEYFPTVASQWENYTGKGAGYVFSVIAAEASADAAIYFSKIYYSDIDEAWTAPELPTLPEPTSVPAPAYEADEVVSLFGSSYTPACTFGVGNWGQSTRYSVETIDGREAAKLVNFNYLGWELNEDLNVSECESMHVDFFPSEETGFGFTPISRGPKEKGYVASEVKVGEWNGYDVPLSYFSDVVDLSEIFQVKFDQGNKGAQCYIGNVYFVKTKTGIENVNAVEVAPARYFRLDGVEMQGSDLPAGIYVVRQGEKATKMIVR
ncbi:MAG: hypothetical protein K2M06_06590 [Muribaculaceae bacterium]|nr:hypothetical protein [Muribaculaceae bacterium]